MFDKFLAELDTENGLGLLLAAQLGTTPAEMVMAVRTTSLDSPTGELKPIGSYTLEVNSLIEHKMTLGPFNHAAYIDKHPILFHHNERGVRIFLSSPAADPQQATTQIEDLYDETFGRWRQLADDLNKRAPPEDVLKNGMGLLGEFPAPFASELSQLLSTLRITHSLVEGEPKIGGFKLIAFDDSYFVARIFKLEAVPTR